jgi:hypothetical protein
MLQRSNRAIDEREREREREQSTTPKAESAVSSVSSPSAESESDNREDQAYEAWLENVRVIEYLREYVIDRLKRKEYETGSPKSSSDDMDVDSPPKESLYPPLPSAA